MVGVPQHLCMKAMCEPTGSHKEQLYAQPHLSSSVIKCQLKGGMLLLRTFAPWLLLAFLGQQVSVSTGARNKNRGADKTVTPAPGRAQRSGNKAAATGRGKFTTGDKMQCTWLAKDVGDTVRLSVKCENREARIKGGVTDLKCEYNGKPQRCPGYQSDPKGFWKQVGRAFKKLRGKVCKEESALVKAGMCKRAPREAHFKLDARSSVASAQAEPDAPTTRSTTTTTTTAAAAAAAPGGPTACTGRAVHLKKAQEHCGSWASVCNFFFSMLQNEDC